ncbi:helicase-exonuclease AddAB subunit AddA [Desulfofundulus thermosubterraneus]|uniref:ATP-dependent helicase/nuclease subunit A n=1 Tax=Desulfofundulus thermosubterraneus DSM 16057 TaxID=1121432 RepID=A0A1M6H9V7_9FIRM|nr:helicase-exonuclease AddAB subunit AddA [Desulfofundulus thermosubterraneus]SHJ18975.1 DNA helicase/exodeoxyribonuclease V, subunit A [Desulfofundulus thermosubterraneus DSM 16057]
MTSTRWTEEQQKAITTRRGNLLVSAAAGSGKTAVLVERIIRRLLDEKNPVDLDRLLVVTFTDAAAGEMRQRVGAALNRSLQEHPAHPLVLRQLFLVPRASIGTLHSFCGEVVRRHFYLLGLDPGFRVMDENEASLLRLEVLEEVLEEYYEEHRESPPDAPFLYLARVLAGRHGYDRELVELVLRLYDYALSLPRPRAWLNWVAESLAGAAARSWEEQPWHEQWQEMMRLELEDWLGVLEEAQRLAAGPGGPQQYAPVLEKDLERVRSWLKLVDKPFQDLQLALKEGQKWPALPRTARGEALDEIKERVKKLRDHIKKRAQGLFNEYFSRSPGDMIGDLARVAPLVQELVAVVLRFGEAYRQTKLERAVADFADLEHYALAILAQNGEGSPWGEEAPADPRAPLLPSPVAAEYREHFVEVLVDEYQDINGVQEAILELVSRGDNRFLVGDVKQSIYRFRLADPTVFLNRYHRFRPLAPGQEPGPGWRLTLRANFRSRPEILETVNYLFGRLMTRRVGELDYDEEARLCPGASFPESTAGTAGGPVEIHLLDFRAPEADQDTGTKGREENGQPDMEELDLVRLEARWVAERVHRLVLQENLHIYDREKREYRPVTWRDVVVLMRSLRGRVGVFLEEFRRLDIPAYADGTGGYFDAPEVETILSALQVIDNPRRDIPLAAVLRSPLVGLDAPRLAEIRLACPEGDFYTAVEKAAHQPPGVDPELAERLRRFLKRLDQWRDLARRLPPAELLEELYRQTGYYDLVGAMPGGVVRQANLRALVDRARRFEGTIYRGLFRFLRFIEQIRDEGGDMDAARSLGENENVVRIMSVHKAKGLEFPVVVVTGLGRRFNLRDLSGNFLFHRRLGCGPVVVDLEKGVRYPTVLHRVIRQRLRLETLAEEMRLLYVALTRARERLILAAAVRNLDRQVEGWRSRVAAVPPEGSLGVSLQAGARCALDWLGPALWSHPALAGFSPGGEPVAAGTGCWQVHLWPAAALQGLWAEAGSGAKEGGPSWTRWLERLEPLPEDWLRQQEESWPGGGAELVSPGELRRRLFWISPHRELARLPSKVTVTEWRHRHEELEEWTGEEVPGEIWTGKVPAERLAPPPEQAVTLQEFPPGFDLPAFYTGEHMSGAERGRVVHLVMQSLELEDLPDEAGVRRHLDRLVEREILRPEELQLVRPAEIARFWRTDLGRRVLAAAKDNRLWREVPFTLGLEVPELYPELSDKVPPGEFILLQGVIDCLLVEENGLVIIDYKTDRLTEEGLGDAVRRYRIQLDLYSRAAVKILARPVLEKYIYFFVLNRAVAV